MMLFFLIFSWTWNPHPESGTVARPLAVKANDAAATLGYRLADAQSKSGALHGVVQLDETVEDVALLFGRNAGARVLAVDVHSRLELAFNLSALCPITHADVPLAGVLDSIGDKVGIHLLQASFVDAGLEDAVGVVFLELHAGLLDTLRQRLADVVEGRRKVERFRLYGQCLSCWRLPECR